MWRIANSIHAKTRLYKVYLTLEQLQTVIPSEIKELAKLPCEIPKNDNNYKRGYKKLFTILAGWAEKFKYVPPENITS